ncbi:hypothetical protein E2C01_075036 [Portunus trituberculatus]|uniref:Uncharacterized protein n=1 Tax=Portunus trituberculatus TaxID=210409 RepID=A0A5B7IER5_PORTR|nr:hypothetical protein [Portunus trituberculatus]
MVLVMVVLVVVVMVVVVLVVVVLMGNYHELNPSYDLQTLPLYCNSSA